MEISIGFKTDVGLRREINEDSYAVLGGSDLLGRLDALVVVADGMGGTGGGDTASRIVAQTMPEATLEIISARSGGRLMPINAEELLRDTIGRAHHKVQMSHTIERPDLRLMGTTCVAGALLDGMLTVANVGDSRAYLFRGDKLSQMTEDHSEVWAEVKAGRMTREEARTNRFRGYITRHVGKSGEVDPDIVPVALMVGDTALFCSDGLTTDVSDEEIARILSCTDDAQLACDLLVKTALERGGRDNITVVVLQYGSRSTAPSFDRLFLSAATDADDDTESDRTWRKTLSETSNGNGAETSSSAQRPHPEYFVSEHPIPETHPSIKRVRETDTERFLRKERNIWGWVSLLLATVALSEAAWMFRAPRQAPAPPEHTVTPVVTDTINDYGSAVQATSKQVQDSCLVIDIHNRPIVASLSGNLVRVEANGSTTPLGSTFPKLPEAAPDAAPDTPSVVTVSNEDGPTHHRRHAAAPEIAEFARDASGKLYVLDPLTRAIAIYTSGGTRVGTDIGKGAFINPSRIAVDSDGNLYVTDRNRLYRLPARPQSTSPRSVHAGDHSLHSQ